MAKKAPEKVAGLIQRGDKWQYDFMYHGARKVATFDTRAQALDAMTILRGSLKDGRLAQEHGLGGPRQPVTVASFYADGFLQSKNPTTAKNDKSVVGRFCGGHGTRTLDAITSATLEHYVARRLKDGKQHSTVGNELRRLSRFFKQALRAGHIKSNPVLDVEKLKVPQRRRVLLEPADERCFWAALPPLYRGLFQVTFYCGLRQGEALGLRVEDVSLTKATLTIVQHKTGAIKTVPLIPKALAILRDVIPSGAAPDAFVFHHDGGEPIAKSTWFDAFDAARRKCKLAGLRPHDLRHSIGQRLADEGVPLHVIGRILGHKPPYRSTLIYTEGREDREQIKSALAGFAKTLA